jgi:primosomal protein N' (replication factor Y)
LNTSSPTILRVAVNVPLAREFDYRPPRGPLPPVGSRVRVPFGRRTETGIVLGYADSSAYSGRALKQAAGTLDETPLLSAEDLALIRFTSDYYHHPVGEVAATALPAALRQGKALHGTTERVVLARPPDDPDTLEKRAPTAACCASRPAPRPTAPTRPGSRPAPN